MTFKKYFDFDFFCNVVAKDFTFSKQIKGKPVPYGEAGDCYSNSRRGCPQGRFNIDLTATGMKVSHETTWVGKGSNTSFWVNKIEVPIKYHIINIIGYTCFLLLKIPFFIRYKLGLITSRVSPEVFFSFFFLLWRLFLILLQSNMMN